MNMWVVYFIYATKILNVQFASHHYLEWKVCYSQIYSDQILAVVEFLFACRWLIMSTIFSCFFILHPHFLPSSSTMCVLSSLVHILSSVCILWTLETDSHSSLLCDTRTCAEFVLWQSCVGVRGSAGAENTVILNVELQCHFVMGFSSSWSGWSLSVWLWFRH